MAKKSPATETQTETEQQTAPVQKNKMTPLRKMSVGTVYGKIKLVDIPEDGALKLCRIAGVARATDSGESNYGVWECLKGDFAATNYQTGEMFVAATAFIPGAMGEAIIAGLNNAQSEDASAVAKFSVDVSVKVSPRDPNKYEYIVSAVMENDIRNEAVALLGMA